MAFSYSPKIVTDGLVLYLDAANPYSYVSGSTVWNDLSRTAGSGSLVNGPTFMTGSIQAISFNSASLTYVATTYTQPAYTTASSFTWTSWVNPVTQGANQIVMGNRYTPVGFEFVKLTTAAFEYYPDNILYGMALNTWQNICVQKSGSTVKYFVNGNLVNSRSTSVTRSVVNNFYVGADPLISEYSSNKIAIISIYDRALSDLEVLQNYNATKGRFGLK